MLQCGAFRLGATQAGKASNVLSLLRQACYRVRKGGSEAPCLAACSERLALLLRSLSDVSHCWRALGRCVSSRAAQRGAGEDGQVVGLLGCVHGLCGCIQERLLPVLEELTKVRSTLAR